MVQKSSTMALIWKLKQAGGGGRGGFGLYLSSQKPKTLMRWTVDHFGVFSSSGLKISSQKDGYQRKRKNHVD